MAIEAKGRGRVVITGLGPITCVGIGKEALWAGLLVGVLRGATGRVCEKQVGGKCFSPHLLC